MGPNKQTSNAIDELKIIINIGNNTPLDITAMVTEVNIQENINSDLQGTLAISDDAGIIDGVILTGNELVNIFFIYREHEVKHVFFIDGISDINLTDKTNSKSYQIILGSLKDYISATNLVSKSYSGITTDIITNIYSQFFGAFSELIIFANTISKCKYIAPNISPKKVIYTLLNKSFDDKRSGLFMFECLMGAQNTYIQSLSNIAAMKGSITIQPTNTFKNNDETVLLVPRTIIINDNVNTTQRSSNGVKGKHIQTLNIHNSSDTMETFRATSTPSINQIVPYRENMYNDGEEPLSTPNKELDLSIINHSKTESFSISASCYDCKALPGLMVGIKANLNVADKRKLNVGQTTIPSMKYSGLHVIGAINHKIVNGYYTQDIHLYKGIA